MAESSVQPLYRARRSLLHDRITPFTKLVAAASLIALAFLLPGPAAPSCIFLCLVVPMAALAKVLNDLCLFLLKGMSPFLLFLFGIYGFMMPAPPGCESLFLSVPVNGDGLLAAWVIGTRVLVMVSALAILLMTTPPSRLMEDLAHNGVHPYLCYMILAAVTLIPRMKQRAASILDAQRSRGLETQGSLRVRIRALFPLLIPLLYATLADAEMRAAALDVRAFNTTGVRSRFILQQEGRAEPLVRRICGVMVAVAAGGRLWLSLR
ncbi:MAG: energy-coupling factor transporter transmembrane protein EcfT [Desulfobacteraceae bacterium]|nr:energy-coupling factor transporter transmembrane protein EcfT [Desulfobacteraceae bacterium]